MLTNIHAPTVSPLFTTLATALLQHRAVFLTTDYAAQLASLEAVEAVLGTAKADVARKAHLHGNVPFTPPSRAKGAKHD